MILRSFSRFVVLLQILLFAPTASSLENISAFDVDWFVSERIGPPSSNRFLGNNVLASESEDSLCFHLTLHPDGGFSGSEISSTQLYGYGTHLVELTQLPVFDVGTVLGIFLYPPLSVGPDGTHEIDIEISSWGSSLRPRGNFGVFSPRVQFKGKPFAHRFELPKINESVFFSISRTPSYVTFAIFSRQQVFQSAFVSDSETNGISDKPLRFFINFWRLNRFAKSKNERFCVKHFQFNEY